MKNMYMNDIEGCQESGVSHRPRHTAAIDTTFAKHCFWKRAANSGSNLKVSLYTHTLTGNVLA
jgi:hypothetical protein